MNFSEVVQHSGLVQFSPDSHYLAVVRSNALTVYLSSDLETKASWALTDTPTQLEWSPDSCILFTTHVKRAVVQLFSLKDHGWTGKITLSPSGLTGAMWSPDSKKVLTFTEFQLRCTIWDLTDMSVNHIRNPKFSDKGVSFTSDGKFMAIAEKTECKDYVGIYFTGDWKVVNHFLVETFDLENIMWAPNDTAIIVWDTCLTYELLVYSPLGHLLARHKAYENGLGIKSVGISPSGEFLAAGSYDQSLRVFTHISWKYLIEFQHKPQVTEGSDLHIYKEEEYKEGPGYEERLTSRYAMQDLPVKLPVTKVPRDKPNPNMGVGLCEWSCDSCYVATRNDNMPSVVWVWNMTTLSLHIIMQHCANVKNLVWNPKTLHLALCTGAPRLFLWSLEGASVCDVPLENKDFKVMKLKWSPSGDCLLLMDKNRLLVAYPQFELLENPDDEDYV